MGGVIQGIKLIIGLITGICILMRHSVMRPLRAEMLSRCVLTGQKTRPPGWIALSSETHYPISMMQCIPKTADPMAGGRKLALFCKGGAHLLSVLRSPVNHSVVGFKRFTRGVGETLCGEDEAADVPVQTVGYLKML